MANNPWDENYSASTGAEPWAEKYDTPAKPSGALRKAVGDKVVGFASGAVGATKALADVAGAGNAVSSTLGDVGKGIDSYLSPEAKADQQEQSAIMADAKGKGTLEGVKAGFKAFGVAPVQTAVQGLGSVVPILAGTALTGGVLPTVAAGGAIGAAMGAGTAKGAIYDRIKQEGGTEEAAIKAQEYGGVNSDQIALGGALGAADALTGVSAAATRMARGALGKPVTQTLTGATERGFVGRAGMGMLKEMPLEAAQGGQEQVAANLAAQRAGYEAGTWDNVASNATLESLASAGPGAAFGAMDTKTAAQPPALPAGESPPGAPLQPSTTPAGTIQDPATSPAPKATPPIDPVREQVAQAATQGGALSGAALVALDTGAHQATAEVAAAAAEAQSAEAAAKPGAKPAEPALPAYSLFDGSYQDGDLHDVGGKPYRSEVAARMRMNATPGSTMEKFSNGFVIRRPGSVSNPATGAAPNQPLEASNGANILSAGLDQPAIAGQDTQPGGSGLAAVDESGPGQPGAVQDNAGSGISSGSTSPVLLAGGGAGAVANEIDKAAHEAATSHLNDKPQPTPEQQKAGNYEKGHIKVHGLDIAIENPKGSTRSGVSPDGTKWANTMGGHYGYFKGTLGNDDDHVDTYVGPNPESNRVFVIDQVNKDGSFDEHKSMIGYDSPEQARESYMSSFMPGWTGLGAMTELPVQAFKSWVKDGKKKQPLGEIEGGKPAPAIAAPAPVAIKNIATPAKEIKRGTPIEDGVTPAISALRGKAHNNTPKTGPLGDVRLSSYTKGVNYGEWVMFDEAVAAAREVVAAGVKPVPFQIHNALDVNLGDTNRIIAALGAPKVSQPAQPVTGEGAGGSQPTQVAPVKQKALPLKQRMEKERTARADYFTPGNIVTSYGGHDEVLSYTPPGAKGEGWSVKVRAVVNQDGKWIADPKDNRERIHSTQPDARHLAKGPVVRAPIPVKSSDLDAGIEQAKDLNQAGMFDEDADQPVSESQATGEFGPILTQYRHDAQGAIKALTELQDGEAVAALQHPEVGDIDLVWGNAGTRESNGSGLAKLVKWHPEVIEDLQGVISSLKVAERTENRIQLESETHKAAVRLEWNGAAKKWLLTAFEKRVVGGGTRTDTTANGVEGDTARLKSDMQSVVQPSTESKQPDTPPAGNDRNAFTLERLNSETGKMEPVTFTRGEYIRYKLGHGEIDGISHAKREFSVDGLWYAFGFAYKAERPEAVKPATVPLSKVIEATNKKHGAGLTEADAVPNPATILDAETNLWSRITDGAATVDEFKAGFENWVSNKAIILEALSKNKKDDLLKMGGSMFAYRNKSETKPEIVEALWRDGANQYVLARSFSHGMGKNAWLDGVRNMVNNTDAEQLAQYVTDRKAAQEEAVARVGKLAEAIKDPKTKDDFQQWMRATMSTGKSFKEARMMLTPAQRAQYDELVATETRATRASRKESEQDASLRAPGEAVTATEIIKTRHTKHGHDLWQFNLDQRVSGDEFKSLVAQAKRLGGDYSSYRGNGAIPGWQFRSEDAAKAFKALIAGDTSAAKDVMQERRDAFSDDRSQSAAERLTEMADRLDEQANASLNQERKANTHKRASQTASAEAAAHADKAMATTMRNIAKSITEGSAKFLDRVRQKVQVSLLQGYVARAKYDELRTRYDSYSEQEKYKGEAPTGETADFAEFPTYTASRSDLASLARQLLEVDGTKLLGQRLLKEADDVSDAYLAFAKENFGKVAAFSTKGGGTAAFGTRADAEASIARSGYKGKAIAYQVKRGEHAVILSPSEAIERGVWKGDGDKRITLTAEVGAELVEKIGKAARRGAKVSAPWQLESAHDRRKALTRMGIETPAEFRAALREFIGLQEQVEAPSKVKQLERAMVGRRNDGMDFFPTPESVADEMVAAAGIEPGMAVLEPSAGWGHIAERIKAAGVDPDVGEMSDARRELLEAKGFNVVGRDFMDMSPRGFTYGDVFRTPDGTLGVMRGSGGLGSSRVGIDPLDANGQPDVRTAQWHDRDSLVGVEKRAGNSGYDRILMNPPFSDGRDIQHVQHAYTLLKPGGRIVAIMGESAFTNQNKRATEFRAWLESVGGTEEKLDEGTFNDPSLPVNTGANARMVVIERGDDVKFSRQDRPTRGTPAPNVQAMVDAVTANWANAPEVVVVADMQDDKVPQRVREADQLAKSQGADGEPDGFIYKGKVYLVSAELPTINDAVRVLMHESLGHSGLRGAFGGTLKPILNQVATMRRADVVAKAREYGLLNPDTPRDASVNEHWQTMTEKNRQVAAEEVLAVMAEKHPELGFVKRAVSAIRNWLRANVPGFKSLAMTDADIIQAFILPARRHIEGGQSKDSMPENNASLAALSRSQDQEEPDIRYSRATVARYAKHATDKLNETFSHPGGMSLWDKTVGSMYHLAERNPPFKRVFNAAQAFIQDVSFYATESADLAPKILPKLDTWKDMLKTPVSAADNKAISAPILQGTLSWARDESGKPVLVDELEASYQKLSDAAKAQMLLKNGAVTEDQLKRWQASPIDIYEGAVRNRFNTAFLSAGVVWKDAELQSMFNLTPAQISLYREFRAATDASLDNLAKADLLRFGGKDVAHMADMVMDAATVDEAAVLLRDYLHSQRDLMPERVDDLTAAAGGMIERADKVNKLKAQGYAPLSRFGRYSVDVMVDGKREYFGLFESKAASNLMALKMKQEYGAASVAQGTMSQKEFELFQGITPESLELFGNMLGLDSTGNEAQDQAFQTYLKLTKTNRSAMKRMIHRKGTAGFSEDMGRVLAAFVYSNARQTSAALHMGELGDSVQAIPKGQGELKDAAVELSDYIKKPREEAQALRGLLFAQYLGGSVASAFVNFTQPLTVSFPYLSMYGGAKQSGAALIQAMKDQREGVKLEDGLRQALHQAEEEGTVSPQSVHELMAQAQGRATLNSGDGTAAGDALAGAKNNLAKLAIGWGKVFGWAEQVNRRSTFIAAYRIAVAQKIANPAAFAIKAVNETQFISNKANKAKFARGAIGATLMTFKSYSTNYLELLHRMATKNGPEGKKAAALMLGMLFLMAGAGGMPFDDDLEDVADGFAQLLGYNFSSKKAKQEFLEDLFGKTMGDFIDKGITGLPGSPLDVSGRMSMGNLIPGTGLLLQKRDHGRDWWEFAGPAGDLLQRAFTGAGDMLAGAVHGDAGEFMAGVKKVSPKAVSNAFKGADMANTGDYNDDKGYKVLAITPFEAAMKAIGFQPHSVAEVQSSNYLHQRAKDFYSQHAQDINARWARGIYENDPGQVAATRAMVQSWNDSNPEQPIRANLPAILKRVQQMRKDKSQRIADTAPKAMRAQIKREVAEGRV